jgi:multiple sugar transport system permease protein
VKRGVGKHTALLGAFCGLLVLDLTPILWGALISVRQAVDAFAVPPRILVAPTWQYHWTIWTQHGFARFAVNSCLIAAFTVLISLPLGSLAGYGLARARGPRANVALAVLLTMRSLPPMLLVIPYYALARALHLVDTYAVLVMALVALNQPFVVWLMRAFFLDLPPELEEAALVDGATRLQAIRLVLLPAILPGMAMAGLFSLLFAYNEFTLAQVLTGPHTRTLPVALVEEGGDDASYWSLSAAAAIGAMVPGILLALALRFIASRWWLDMPRFRAARLGP